MGKPITTRPPIFRDVQAPQQSEATVVPKGSRRFEQARARLADLATREPEQVSDADVYEFLRRGELATQVYLSTIP